MTEIVVVGDVMVDVLVRAHGALAPGTDRAADISIRPGGSAANVACWLAAAGVGVTLAGRVGAGDHAAQVADLLTYRVVAQLGRDGGLPTGRVVALIDADGERSFYTDRGANAALGAADLPRSLLDEIRLLHVSGHVLTRPDPATAARALMRDACDRGVAVSVDAGSAGWLEADPRDFLGQLADCRTLFANAAEADLLWPGREPTLAGGVVVVTRGRLGATAYWQAGRVDRPASAVRVADTVGAGDGFVAGFLAARLRDSALPACLDAGIAAAGHAVAVLGGRPDLHKY